MPTDEEIGKAYRDRQAKAARAQKGKPSPAQVEARKANAAKATAARLVKPARDEQTPP